MIYHFGVHTVLFCFILSPEIQHGSTSWQDVFPTFLELSPSLLLPSCLCPRVCLCLGAHHPRVPSPFSGHPTSSKHDRGYYCSCQSYCPCCRVTLMSKCRMSLSIRLTSFRWERQARTHCGVTYAFPGESDALQKQQGLIFRSEASKCQFQGKAKSKKTKGKRIKSNFIHETKQ